MITVYLFLWFSPNNIGSMYPSIHYSESTYDAGEFKNANSLKRNNLIKKY